MTSITELLKDCGDKRIENAIRTDSFIKELKTLANKRVEIGERPFIKGESSSLNNLVELHRIDDLIVEKVLKFYKAERSET
jgi:hypothetical protein